VVDAAKGYSTLEYNTATMARGSRHDHCSNLLRMLTGAEDAIAVNNNAAATYMVLSELAKGTSAIVSRGEEVEIGGSFRIPDIMSYADVDMIEVGTTNKTHARDYKHVMTDDVSLLLKVHTSNYRISGFTEAVSIKELREIADAENERRASNDLEGEVLVYGDLGSGALLPIETSDGGYEPVVSEALKDGCDIVTFSGDKLLGGPQAGIIAGRADLIARLKQNPLARVCRLDKMTLAALEATLRLYTNPDNARQSIPTLRMLDTDADTIKVQCEALASKIESKTSRNKIEVSIKPEISRAGGGALPMCELDTYVVCIDLPGGDVQDCATFLIQENATPIIARIHNNSLLFDPRTILNDQEMDEIAEALAHYLQVR
jgi:L-seryl-tRNA(Ser) seleniumtransferase